MPGRYINPFTDFGFKKIFGEEANKDLLISFLNELLVFENQEISDLTYKKNEHLPENDAERKVVYDLFCENKYGEKFIVEMQRAKQTYFKDRMLFYSTFSISEQAPKGFFEDEAGNRKEWNYELKSVYVIALLNFKIPLEGKMNGKLITRSKLLDVEEHNVFYDKLTFITIELPYFTKTIDELETNFDKWIYVLKNLDTFDRIPEKIKDKIFKKLFSVAEYANLTTDEQLEYQMSLGYYWDLLATINTAKIDAKEEERQKLLPLVEQAERKAEQERKKAEQERKKAEQERKKAEQERQKAEQERKEKEQANKRLIQSAKLMKDAGLSTEQIMLATGLSKEEIEKL